jgi:outer membrane receptor protein involved in Fe transport
MNWSDDIFYGVNEGRGLPGFDGTPSLPEYAIAQKAYFLHNLRLAYRTPTSNIEVAGWVRNLEDTVYKTFAFDASFSRQTLNFVGDPRTIGFDVTFTF